MIVIQFNNRSYYLYDDLVKKDSTVFTHKFIKNFVTKIDNKYKTNKQRDLHYCRLYKFGNIYKITYSNTHRCAKLYISKKYIDKKYNINENVNTISKDNNDFEKLPKVISLEPYEKFGGYDIEVVGERDKHKCFFKVEDIGYYFKIDKLHYNIVDNFNYNVIYNQDYKIFSSVYGNQPYFTYSGLIAFIMRYNSEEALKYREYILNILFISQMGTSEQKAEMITTQIIKTESDKKTLITKLGCNAVDVKKTLSLTTHISCIYLLYIKKEGDDHIFKIGYTNNLKRRLGEHIHDFVKTHKISDVIYVKHYQYIDLKYIKEAESELIDYFNSNFAKIDFLGVNRKEVYSISEKKINTIIKFYNKIGLAYGGKITQLNEDLKIKSEQLTLESNNINHKLELHSVRSEATNSSLQKEIEFKDFQINSIKTEYELKLDNLKKEIQLLKLEMKLKELSYN